MAGDAESTVVVIGGGPCAAVAARELVAAGLDVTMLDAGHRAPRGITVRAAGRTLARFVEPGFRQVNRPRCDPDGNVEWTSSLSFGGLTNFWTGAVPRFAPDDFTEGGRLDERYEWPIRYDDLVPFYELVEDDMRVTAGGILENVPAGRTRWRCEAPPDWRSVADAARAAGHQMAPIPIAKGSPWMVALRAREFSSYHCIVKPLRRRPRFRLVAGARVLRLHHDSASGRVDSVEYVDRATNEVRRVHARAFVVAAGTIDSAEILLRSVSSDHPAGLGNAHGVLGRYLHDHPKEWWPARLDRAMTALHHPLYVSRDPIVDAEPLLATSLTVALASGKDRLYTLANRPVARVGVQVFGTVVPTDDVGVELTGDPTDDDAASMLRLRLDFGDRTVALMDAAKDRFREIMGLSGIGAELGPFHDLVPGTSFHLGGGVRMHDDPRFGVLDRWNRVHGVPNVVVSDASSFTTGPEKNPTLTAMAISARAARHLATSVLSQ